MPNTYFQFKQFTIQQDRTAMKVSTDACLFGAWMADILKEMPIKNALDIGTGTGLLSLQLLQELPSLHIEAIELDASAANQADENRLASPWADRMQLIQKDVLDFQPAISYDLIFSNPPFFEQSLISSDARRNLARHESTLTLSKLCESISNMLVKENGFAALLIPEIRTGNLLALAEHYKLYALQQVTVRHTKVHAAFRTMVLFTNKTAYANLTAGQQMITIKEGNLYSARFKELLFPYYLYL